MLKIWKSVKHSLCIEGVYNLVVGATGGKRGKQIKMPQVTEATLSLNKMLLLFSFEGSEGYYYKRLCTFSRRKAKDAYCIRCQCILLLNRRADHLHLKLLEQP